MDVSTKPVLLSAEIPIKSNSPRYHAFDRVRALAMMTAISLILFEVFVRHTPLVYIFGPASLGKKIKNPLNSTPPPTTPVPPMSVSTTA